MHHPRGLSQDIILSNRREMALELVSGADFFLQIDVRGGPGRSKGVPGAPGPPRH